MYHAWNQHGLWFHGLFLVWYYHILLFQCGGGDRVGSVLVCQGCRNKAPLAHTIDIYCLAVLEAGNPTSRCRQGCDGGAVLTCGALLTVFGVLCLVEAPPILWLHLYIAVSSCAFPLYRDISHGGLGSHCSSITSSSVIASAKMLLSNIFTL